MTPTTPRSNRCTTKSKTPGNNNSMNIKTLALVTAWATLWTISAYGAGERLPIGEFIATRFEKAPVIDGKSLRASGIGLSPPRG